MRIYDTIMQGVSLPFRLLGMSYLISLAILPAQNDETIDETSTVTNEPNIKPGEIETADGAKLQLYTITPSTAVNKHSKAILYFLGNSGYAEGELSYLEQLADETGVTIYTINYRSVGTSKQLNFESRHLQRTHSIEDLYQDARAVYDYAIEEGYKGNEIELLGYSLGGVVASKLAYNVTNELTDINNAPHLTTEMTLSSFTSFIAAYLLGSSSNFKYGHLDPRKHYFGIQTHWAFLYELPLKVLHVSIALSATLTCAVLLMLSNWESHTGYHFANHPVDKRTNVYARAPKEKREQALKENVEYTDDAVMRPYGALYNSWFVQLSEWWHSIDKQKHNTNRFYMAEKYKHANAHSNCDKLHNNLGQTLFQYHCDRLKTDLDDSINPYYFKLD